MTFEQRLDILYDIIEKEKQEKNKLVLPNPELEITTTNTFWYNTKDLMKKINRPPQHFIDFLGHELSTEVTQKTSSLSDGLILKGKQNKNKLLPLIEKYIKHYVLCKNCLAYSTKIKKDVDIRKYILTCKSCNSSYTI